MRTFDQLADPNRREIVTTFTTDIRVDEGNYNAGTVRVALTTTHRKNGKRLETRLNREVVTDSGFVIRSFMVFGPASADAGIVLATEPVARFNAAKARTLHQQVLDNLPALLADSASPVAGELSDLFARAA